MNLLVGHTCPGCGRDTPELKCATCDGAIVWDACQGSHCRDCGKPSASLICEECGRESDI